MSLGPRPRLTLELTAAAAALLLGAATHAQAPAPSADLERAQKAADAVFHWIKLNGDKGANRQPPAPAPAPAPRKPAPIAAAPKPVPAPAARNAAGPAEPPATVAAAPTPVAPPDSAPVLLASAAPTPTPDAPLALAAPVAQPPAPPAVEEEVPLKLLSRISPTIPRQMQKESFRDAYARVKFTVAPDGTVSQAESIKASHSRLGIAAVEAVKQWRFAPIPAAREAAIEFAFSNLDD